MVPWIHIGNQMDHNHTWSTSSSDARWPFKTSAYMLITKQMKATPQTGAWSHYYWLISITEGEVWNLVIQFAKSEFFLLLVLPLILLQQNSFNCSIHRISIRAGNHFNDLSEIEQVELSEPSGWVAIALKDLHGKPIRTFMIQIAVLSNHQNGRDTHMRQIKIHSPVQDVSVAKRPNFTTVQMSQYSCIRWFLYVKYLCFCVH